MRQPGEQREAGYDTDIEIATGVFGMVTEPQWGRHQWPKDGPFAGRDGRESVPEFSADMALAFTVVEAMQKYCCDLSIEKAGNQWYVDFRVGTASANTLPLAVCLAALNAISAATPAEASVQNPSSPVSP